MAINLNLSNIFENTKITECLSIEQLKWIAYTFAKYMEDIYKTEKNVKFKVNAQDLYFKLIEDVNFLYEYAFVIATLKYECEKKNVELYDGAFYKLIINGNLEVYEDYAKLNKLKEFVSYFIYQTYLKIINLNNLSLFQIINESTFKYESKYFIMDSIYNDLLFSTEDTQVAQSYEEFMRLRIEKLQDKVYISEQTHQKEM